MKIIIFAGGSGRRLWPISLKSSPKQFEPIIGDQSTLQLAVERVLPEYGAENIYISTNELYLPILAKQLPMLPESNLIGEPSRRDLAGAVGLAVSHLAKSADPDEPIAILWGDNYMDDVPTFRQVLKTAEQLVANGTAKITFMGETPRFANDNLGWIGLGEQLGTIDEQPYYRFLSLNYRPALESCQTMFTEKTHVWNTGYFVTTPRYVQTQYALFQPDLWQKLSEISATIGTDNYKSTLHAIYPKLPVMSFDDAVLERLEPHDAIVLHGEMGWSDPGTLYALKEAINPHPNENVTRGQVQTLNTQDSLIYNYESNKLVAAIGLEGMIVVNTEQAVLVVHKNDIKLVKKMVDELVGTDLEKYT